MKILFKGGVIRESSPSRSWAQAYSELAEKLGEFARWAPLTICGMSACTDARIELGATRALFETKDPKARAFADRLLRRAAQGDGGEIRVDWDDGPRWLARHARIQYALGGTGPQAA